MLVPELTKIQPSPWYNRCLPYKLRPVRLSLVARSLVLNVEVHRIWDTRFSDSFWRLQSPPAWP
jgi:hypothetical protein